MARLICRRGDPSSDTSTSRTKGLCSNVLKNFATTWHLCRSTRQSIPPISMELRPARKTSNRVRSGPERNPFTREQFRYESKENVYYCPEGKPLRYRGQSLGSQGYLYCSTAAQCHGCPQKKSCTPGLSRRLFVHWQEPARQIVRALADTPEYKRSQRARYKIEALFAELKQQIKLRRVCDYDCGTSLSSSTSRQRLKT
jgi:hypothetical protein